MVGIIMPWLVVGCAAPERVESPVEPVRVEVGVDAPRVDIRLAEPFYLETWVQRHGYDGEIDVAAVDPPNGFVVSPERLTSSQSRTTLLVSAAGALPGGPYPLELRATPDDPAVASSRVTVDAYVSSDPGSLDIHFSEVGVFTRPGFAPHALVLDADGRILIAGIRTAVPRVLRLTAEGGLDGAFGSGGEVTVDPSGSYGLRLGLAPMADGGVLVLAARPSGSVLERFRADGSLDAAFGFGGFVVLGPTSDTASVAVGPDRIVVCGGDDVVPVTLSGAAEDPWPLDGARCQRVHADDEGGVTVGAVRSGSTDFEVVRFGPDGNLDAGFGVEGRVRLDTSPGDDLSIVASYGRGDATAAFLGIGSIDGADQPAWALRVDGTGAVPTFGAGGLVHTGDAPRRPHAVVVDGADRLVLLRPGAVVQSEVVRWSAQGVPDPYATDPWLDVSIATLLAHDEVGSRYVLAGLDGSELVVYRIWE